MMAVRLLEMRRIPRPARAMFLHCGPTADAYLRILCDTVFGAANFRNQIVWKRTSSAAQGTRNVAAIHDVILFDAVSPRMATRPLTRRATLIVCAGSIGMRTAMAPTRQAI